MNHSLLDPSGQELLKARCEWFHHVRWTAITGLWRNEPGEPGAATIGVRLVGISGPDRSPGRRGGSSVRCGSPRALDDRCVGPGAGNTSIGGQNPTQSRGRRTCGPWTSQHGSRRGFLEAPDEQSRDALNEELSKKAARVLSKYERIDGGYLVLRFKPLGDSFLGTVLLQAARTRKRRRKQSFSRSRVQTSRACRRSKRPDRRSGGRCDSQEAGAICGRGAD